MSPFFLSRPRVGIEGAGQHFALGGGSGDVGFVLSMLVVFPSGSKVKGLPLVERGPSRAEAVEPCALPLPVEQDACFFHSLFDLPSEWYLKTRRSVQQFTICQIGECPLGRVLQVPEGDTCVVFVYPAATTALTPFGETGCGFGCLFGFCLYRALGPNTVET